MVRYNTPDQKLQLDHSHSMDIPPERFMWIYPQDLVMYINHLHRR